jgi:hypothetical protein
MTDVIDIAQLLRTVKSAEKRFIALWALDCLFDESRFIEKLSNDLRDPEHPCSNCDLRTMNT